MSYFKKIARKLLAKLLQRLIGDGYRSQRRGRGWANGGRDRYRSSGRSYYPRRKGSGAADKAYKALKYLNKNRSRW